MDNPYNEANAYTELAVATPHTNKRYYQSYGTHHFQVGLTLYKIQGNALSDFSKVFSDMFSAPNTTGGNAPDEPIYLEGITENEFELFLGASCGQFIPSPVPFDQALNLLKMGHMYDAPSALAMGKQQIWERRYHNPPSTLLSIACQFQIHEWIEPAFRRLCRLSMAQITPSQFMELSPNILYSWMQVREVMDQHTRLIAAEAPELVHSADCKHALACETDWRAAWWNGMGRYLLDGRMPQKFDEAWSCVKHKFNFGRMHPDCFQAVSLVCDDNKAEDVVYAFVGKEGAALATKLAPNGPSNAPPLHDVSTTK